jgi:HEAT repeat protein
MVEAMASSGKVSVIDHVSEALREDEDAGVRVAAAKGLGLLRDEGALNPLIKAMEDRKPEVRTAVVQSLRQIGDTRAIPVLLDALRDANNNVRWHAATALTALGWRPNTNMEFVLRAVALGQHEDAAAYGKEAVEFLVKALLDPTSPKRQAAATALGKIGDIQAAKPLEVATEDDDGHVRAAAVEALSHIGGADAGPVILRRVRDKDPHVRASAVEALARMGDPRIIEPIAETLLTDGSWEVRKFSVEALGRIRHERGAELLCRALKDSDNDVRQTAANALGQIPDSRSIPPLVLALKDENSSVRQAAKAALRQIDRQWELSPGAHSVIPELEIALNDREYWVAQSAADTLAKINDMRQRQIEPSADSDPAVQRQELAISLLVDTLTDIDRDMRQAAAEALGRIVDDRVVAPLVAALDDRDEWVGRAAALALNHLNWTPSPEDEPRVEKFKTLMQRN